MRSLSSLSLLIALPVTTTRVYARLGPATLPAVAENSAQVVITRAPAESRALVRALRTIGLEPVLLPALALRPVPELNARTLADRLATLDALIALSPAGVRFARHLLPRPRLRRGLRLYAIGQGSSAALRRWTGREVIRGSEPRSEGLLASEALSAVEGWRIGLLGAPGGRRLLADTLAARGAKVELIAVYRREPARWDRRHRQRLNALERPWVLCSSEQALRALLSLAGTARFRLLSGTAIVSSPRLARLASECGFTATIAAPGPSPGDFVETLRRAGAAR